MKLNPQDLEKITDLTLSYYNEHAEDFWEDTRDHNVNENIAALTSAKLNNCGIYILQFSDQFCSDVEQSSTRRPTARQVTSRQSSSHHPILPRNGLERCATQRSSHTPTTISST
jgi:hypothetical protein